MGNSANHKGYLCFDFSTGQTFISRDVRFDEIHSPFASKPNLTLPPTTSTLVHSHQGPLIISFGTTSFNHLTGPPHPITESPKRPSSILLLHPYPIGPFSPNSHEDHAFTPYNWPNTSHHPTSPHSFSPLILPNSTPKFNRHTPSSSQGQALASTNPLSRPLVLPSPTPNPPRSTNILPMVTYSKVNTHRHFHRADGTILTYFSNPSLQFPPPNLLRAFLKSLNLS